MVDLPEGFRVMKFGNRIFMYSFSGCAIVITCLFMVADHSFTIQHTQSEIGRGAELTRLVALESRDLILINDRVSLLEAQLATLESSPKVAYIFTEKDGAILSHTFDRGVPRGLLDLTDSLYHDSLAMNQVED